MTNQSKVDNNSSENVANRVSTFGWDTAYVAPYTVINHAIQVQKSFPHSFNYIDDSTGIRLRGAWFTWQLCVGGAGQNVQMECRVKNGTVISGGQGYPLDNARLIIQVNLKSVAAFDPINTTAARGGSSEALVVNTDAHDNDPAVAVISGTYPSTIPSLIRATLNQLFAGYFNTHTKDFNHTFAVMDVNTIANRDDFQWLRPTAFQYAVASPESPTLANSAFGLIAMVDGNTIAPYQQQAVDSRALDQLPPGANSAFVISQSMVAKHMLMKGAIATIQHSSARDFELSSDGLSVVNSRDIVWGKFKTDHGVISPLIKKGNFSLRTDNTYVLVEIVDAEYENSPGITVHMNLTQKFTYKTVQKKNGEWIFIPDMTDLGQPEVTATVSVAEGLKIAEIVIGAVAILASLVCVGAAIAGRVAATATYSVSESSATADVILRYVRGSIVDIEGALEEAAVSSVAGGVQSGGVCSVNMVRNIAGMTAAITGAAAGSMMAAKAITSLNYDNIPAFNEFAANCLEGTMWPATRGYALKSASFRDSLVLNIDLDLEQESIPDISMKR